ncbi:hypothetical protein FOZ60_003257 [Perkinsus olseni]|uniref:Uncharacterized protein n=1 Tax=Perkinsus olseni TaxID=32597 RepID=A0A7J6NWN4_PEROL|nr:hypothetical protein FOZ60_003257 [Perkinsus olseni]
MDSIFFEDDPTQDHGGCCANRERAEKARQAKLLADLEAANARAFTARLAVHTAVEKSLRSPTDSRLPHTRGGRRAVPLVNFRRVARMTVGGDNAGKPVLVCLSPCSGREEPQKEPWIEVFRHAAAALASSVCCAACIICLPNNPTATCGDSECQWRLDLPSKTPQEERAEFNFAKQCLLPMMMFGTDPVIIAWRGRGISGMICGKEKLSDPAAVNRDALSKITGISTTPKV